MKKRFILAYLWSAYGILQWFISYLKNDARYKKQKEMGRFRNNLGFTSLAPTMLNARWRIELNPSKHNYKNLMTEWVRLDAQRGAKLLCFIGVVGWTLSFILALVLLLVLL